MGRFVCALSAALLLLASPVQAGIGGAGYPFRDEDALRNYPWVVTAEIVSVAGGTTNGEPPLVVVRVLEPLKGEAAAGASYESLWNPPYADAEASTPEEELQREAWYDLPNPPPAVGSRWILTGEWSSGLFRITEGARYPLSQPKLDWAKANVR